MDNTFNDVPNQNVVLGFITSANLTTQDIRKSDQNIDIYYIKSLINQAIIYDLI